MILENVYVLDKLENIGAYARLGDGFARAAALLAGGDFSALQPGRNELDGERVYVNVADASLVRPQDRRAELHRAYFDIHVPLEGEEVIGLATYDALAKGSFDVSKDVGFYDQPVSYVTVRPGEFLITWPHTCVHAPACTFGAPHVARKLIVKIRA